MARPAELSIRYLPGRATLAVTLAAGGVAWALVVVGLLLSHEPLDLAVPLAFAVLALVATRHYVALRRTFTVDGFLLDRRTHGDLAAADDDHRALRPVGACCREVASRTDEVLAGLTDIPSVRIFRGIRPTGARRAVAAHAVSAGRLLILVESVAWPPGGYAVDAAGRVCCGEHPIGQTTGPLVAAVRALRVVLPINHRVTAMVAVRRSGGDGHLRLPADTRLVSWVFADELALRLRARLSRYPRTVSRHTIAALTHLQDG
jgi:hypothetical protein